MTDDQQLGTATEVPDGVRLQFRRSRPDLFTQLFPVGTAVTDHALGWHWYLDKLAAEVSGRTPPPAWDDFLAATAAYERPR